MTGYIKLFRKFREWGWYSSPCVKDVFIELLLIANYKNSEFRGRTVERGQAVFSLDSLSNSLGYSRRQIETAIKKLKSTGEISVWTNRQFSIATINKFNDYQMLNECETNVKRTLNECETDVVTNVNVIRIEEEKKERKERCDEIPDEISEAFADFEKMRKAIKKPLTPAAKKRALSKLQSLAPDNIEEQRRILNQSVDHCWQDLYALKSGSLDKPDTHIEEMRRAMNYE